MISTTVPFSCPTTLAVDLGGCCNVPISLNVHLMYRSSIVTAGQDWSCCYLRFLPAKIKTAIPTVGKEILVLFLNVNAANTQCYIAADYEVLCRPSVIIYVYIYPPSSFLRKPKCSYLKSIEKCLRELFVD